MISEASFSPHHLLCLQTHGGPQAPPPAQFSPILSAELPFSSEFLSLTPLLNLLKLASLKLNFLKI